MKKILTVLQAEWFILCCITLIALVVRFWHLDTLPAALNRDEAALGYNAWMLQTIGKDEWGKSWPLTLKSFGDYKLPGYPLVTIVSFSFFGRSDWSVRFPSALAGTLLPLAVWYLTKQLQWKKNKRLLAAVLVALLPFSIFYSRMAFEANVALTLMVWVFGLLLRFMQQKSTLMILLPLSIWLAAIFTYNTPLLLTPFLIIGLLVWFGKNKKPQTFFAVIGLSLVLLISTALLWQLNSQKAGISIFTDPTIETKIIEVYTAKSGIDRLLASRYVVYAEMLNQHFWESWSSSFLVTHGGSHPWHTVPGTGHITWFGYLFGCLGVLLSSISIIQTLLKKQDLSRTQRGEGLLIWLLLAGLAPSVVTVDSPHATRSLIFMLLLAVFSAVGVSNFYVFLKKTAPSVLLAATVGLWLFGTGTTGKYLVSYFTEYPNLQTIFQPGLEVALSQLKKTDKPVLVAGDGYTYISIAWYLPVKPQAFLDTITRHKVDTIGFELGRSVDVFTIRPDFKTPDVTNSAQLEWTASGWVTH